MESPFCMTGFTLSTVVLYITDYKKTNTRTDLFVSLVLVSVILLLANRSKYAACSLLNRVISSLVDMVLLGRYCGWTDKVTTVGGVRGGFVSRCGEI